MATPQDEHVDVYHFSDHGPSDDPNRPPADVRYLASTRGAWAHFWIQERPHTAGLAAMAPDVSVIGSISGMAEAEMAIGIRPYFLKTSEYHKASAFVRMDVKDGTDRKDALAAVVAALGHDEVQLVERPPARFDMLAYVGGATDPEVDSTIDAKLRSGDVPVKVKEVLHVTNYVSRSKHALEGHRIP